MNKRQSKIRIKHILPAIFFCALAFVATPTLTMAKSFSNTDMLAMTDSKKKKGKKKAKKESKKASTKAGRTSKKAAKKSSDRGKEIKKSLEK